MKKIIPINLMTTIFFMILALSAQAQEPANKTEDTPEDLQQFMEEGMKEIEFYSLEELLNVEIEVASLFMEDELVVGSMVSSISENSWKQLGARRVTDVIANELSVFVYPLYFGNNVTAIRGYANDALKRGTAYLLDGVPMNDFHNGSTQNNMAELGPGTLEKIELIKGPGSAIYGTDAFHGVISLKTFESDKDHYSFEMAGAYPLYGDANVKFSQGFQDNLFRINMAVSTTGQPEQEQDYIYDFPGSSVPPAPPAKGSGTRNTKYQSHTGVFKMKIDPSKRFTIRLGSYINRSKFDGFPGFAYQIKGGSLENFDLSKQETMFHMDSITATYTFKNQVSAEINGYYNIYNAVSTMYIDHYGSSLVENITTDRSGAGFILRQPDNPMGLQWIVAYTFSHMAGKNMKYKSISFNPSEPGIPWTSQPYEGKSKVVHSPFVQAKWGVIKDALYLLLGGRMDNYSDYGNQFTPRAGLIFLPTIKSSIKALYGRAFRAATAGEIYGSDPYLNENKDLRPETIDIYELVLMYKDDDLKITANGFYSNWKNGIIIEPDFDSILAGGKPGKTVNKGESRSYGGEFSVFYAFNPFAIDLGISYVRSKAYDVSVSWFTDETEDQDYKAFPEYIARAGFRYNLTRYKTYFFQNNRFCYKMAHTHYNKLPTEEVTLEDLPLYWRMDFNINKVIDNHSDVTLDIRNLLNRKNYIPSLNGATDGLEEPGISVLLRAGYKF